MNVEVASPEWVTENADPDGPFAFVEYDDTNPAHVGHGWQPIGGFEKPPTIGTPPTKAPTLRQAADATLAADELLASTMEGTA